MKEGRHIDRLDVRIQNLGKGHTLTVGIGIDGIPTKNEAAWIAGQLTGCILSNGFLPPQEITSNLEEE
jgi:hypothetical protein